MPIVKSGWITCSALAFSFLAAGAQTSTAPSGPVPYTPYPSHAPLQSNQATGNGLGGLPVPPTQDAMFARKALKSDREQIAMAQLALQKSTDEEMRKFAHKVLGDHAAMLKDMANASQDTQYAMEPASKSSKAKLDQLGALSGHDFDVAYMQAMVKEDKANVSAFTYELQNGLFKPVKNAATRELPRIETDLQMAGELEKKIGAASGGSASTSVK